MLFEPSLARKGVELSDTFVSSPLSDTPSFRQWPTRRASYREGRALRRQRIARLGRRAVRAHALVRHLSREKSAEITRGPPLFFFRACVCLLRKSETRSSQVVQRLLVSSSWEKVWNESERGVRSRDARFQPKSTSFGSFESRRTRHCPSLLVSSSQKGDASERERERETRHERRRPRHVEGRRRPVACASFFVQRKKKNTRTKHTHKAVRRVCAPRLSVARARGEIALPSPRGEELERGSKKSRDRAVPTVRGQRAESGGAAPRAPRLA